MVAHCVNPSCYAPLHSLSGGRLFQFEVVSISVSASDDTSAPFDEKPQSQTAQFWLCATCAASMSLVLEPSSGLQLVPRGTEAAAVRGFPLSGKELREANNC